MFKPREIHNFFQGYAVFHLSVCRYDFWVNTGWFVRERRGKSVNETERDTLKRYLVREHEADPSRIRYSFNSSEWLFVTEDTNSHDPLLLHNTIKLRLFSSFDWETVKYILCI